jgi:hypothetical protein
VSGAEECAYGVEWHIPHPSLVAVRRKGKSHSLKVFVRGDERSERFGVEVLGGLDLYRDDFSSTLYKEVDFNR